MFPRQAKKHAPHADAADAILSGKSRHADPAFGETLPRFNHLFLGEFSNANSRSNGLTFFGYLVRHIIGVCTKKQVVGINAGWVIAMVQNMESIGNWAMCQLPRNTVSRDDLAVDLHLPITFAASISLPLPTVIRAENLHLRPEMLCKWRGTAAAGMVSLNEPGWFALNLAAFVCVSCGNAGLFAATTVAITVGNIVRGMIIHSNVSLLDLLTPPNDSTRCGGNFIGFYSFIIPQGRAS